MLRTIALSTLALFVCAGTVLPSGPEKGAASVKRVPESRIYSASREIDTLIQADLAKHKIQPNAPASDAVFFRRAYLDIIGRIPNAKETRAFLGSKDSRKREKLIDTLLDSPGYESHMFNWLADLLRLQTRLRQASGEPYMHFVKKSLRENTPYDAFVRQLLTATGPAYKRGNGATGYYLRDYNMPEDNMSNTARIFLGTRLECAQCHNHPFDKWTQKNYYQMVAFTGGIRYRDYDYMKSDEAKQLREMDAEYKKAAKGNRENLEMRAFRKVIQPLGYGIDGSGSGLYRLPHDYQYDDAKPSQVVLAKSMFGPDAKVDAKIPVEKTSKNRKRKTGLNRGTVSAPPINSREAYAAWMTSPTNPRFTQVICNRMWKRAMGVALVEPIDNLTDDSAPSNPQLMAMLQKLMVDLKFDLKQFQRVIFNTKTYQREATRKELIAGEPYHFQGPVLRRMAAEQIWDSMVTLVEPQIDTRLADPGVRAERYYKEYEDLLGGDPKEIKEEVEMMALRYSDPKKYREVRAQMQAKERKERDKQRAALAKKSTPLKEAYMKAKKEGDRKQMMALRQEMASMMRAPQTAKGGNRGSGAIARASDLPSPAPPSHFLRQFGQSDRDQIENSHREPNVPQVLSLLNGFAERYIILSGNSALNVSLNEAGSDGERIRCAYLTILNREPTSEERSMWIRDLKEYGSKAIPDLVWTLINTHEFIFVQ